MKHNRWLNWKLNHGLAPRGRSGQLKPVGAMAKLLFRMHFKKFNVEPQGPRLFTQDVGGTLGATGKIDGE